MFNMLSPISNSLLQVFSYCQSFHQKKVINPITYWCHTPHIDILLRQIMSLPSCLPRTTLHFITLQVILRNTCYPQVAQFVRKMTFRFPRRRSLSSVFVAKKLFRRITVSTREEWTICRGSPNDNDTIFQMQLLFLESRGWQFSSPPSCGKPRHSIECLCNDYHNKK